MCIYTALSTNKHIKYISVGIRSFFVIFLYVFRAYCMKYIHTVFVCSTLMWLHHHGHCQFMADSCIYPFSAGLYPGLCHQFRSWGRHQIETFLALLALWVCRPPVTVTGAFPLQRPETWALMFTLMWTWANCWTNNGGASDLDDIMSMWRHCSMHTNCCSVLETLTCFFYY